MAGQIFNIPASCSFTGCLAEKFSRLYQDDPAGLAETLFLVPNRRAGLALREAFVRYKGLTPSILPRIIPVGDMSEDEVFFSPLGPESLNQLPAAIDEFERLFLFSRLIMAKPGEYGLPTMTFSQAFALARNLASLLDQIYNEELSFDGLQKLVPEQYAAHWQQTLSFLKIITEYWPSILKERGLADSAQRRNVLLGTQAEVWLHAAPRGKVIAAGITAAFPGLKRLLEVIRRLPEGEIYLCGLDRELDEQAWSQVDETHPQYEHKQLLENFGLTRREIPDLVAVRSPGREKLVSEVMRPAAATGQWRTLEKDAPDALALDGLKIINCRDQREEAAAVAVILRQTIETPEKTAALVTPDRELARRVMSELERWNIKIDDSAGKPLHQMPVGIFLRQILAVVENHFSQTAVLALAKNPLTCLGYERETLRREVWRYEYEIRRPVFNEIRQEVEAEWINCLKQKLMPLVQLYEQPACSLHQLVTTHLSVAEAVASATSEETGAARLWRGDDGREAAALFSRLLPGTVTADKIEPFEYSALLNMIMSAQAVRPVYGTHPRLKILGPIEARFNDYDVVIVGGLNEGVWPAAPGSDPWLSRPMKKDFGLSLPEKAIGILAADLSRLMCAPEVYLTRPCRADGAPTNKSRWLLRLETVLKAYGLPTNSCGDEKYLSLAAKLDQPVRYYKIAPPAPCPPLSARPRCLSASAVETLMRDPYEIYARKILGLRRLNELDQKLSPSDYGSIVHKILEEFTERFSDRLPPDALPQLLKTGRDIFARSHLAEEVRAFWWPAFEKTAAWFIKTETTYRPQISRTYTELTGTYHFEAPGGEFTLQARADRLDQCCDGTINIIDYKTGELRSAKEVAAGYAPQLPIEGVIARSGGFEYQGQKILPARVNKLIYWKLGEKCAEYEKDTEELLDKTIERVKRLISVFDFENTPYLARPNPRHLPKYSDYEHLARAKEWSGEGGDDTL